MGTAVLVIAFVFMLMCRFNVMVIGGDELWIASATVHPIVHPTVQTLLQMSCEP